MDKWEQLKLWIGKRHDYLEAQYKASNFSADAAELGAYRAVFSVMRDLEEIEARKKMRAPVPTEAAKASKR